MQPYPTAAEIEVITLGTLYTTETVYPTSTTTEVDLFYETVTASELDKTAAAPTFDVTYESRPGSSESWEERLKHNLPLLIALAGVGIAVLLVVFFCFLFRLFKVARRVYKRNKSTTDTLDRPPPTIPTLSQCISETYGKAYPDQHLTVPRRYDTADATNANTTPSPLNDINNTAGDRNYPVRSASLSSLQRWIATLFNNNRKSTISNHIEADDEEKMHGSIKLQLTRERQRTLKLLEQTSKKNSLPALDSNNNKRNKKKVGNKQAYYYSRRRSLNLSNRDVICNNNIATTTDSNSHNKVTTTANNNNSHRATSANYSNRHNNITTNYNYSEVINQTNKNQRNDTTEDNINQHETSATDTKNRHQYTPGNHRKKVTINEKAIILNHLEKGEHSTPNMKSSASWFSKLVQGGARGAPEVDTGRVKNKPLPKIGITEKKKKKKGGKEETVVFTCAGESDSDPMNLKAPLSPTFKPAPNSPMKLVKREEILANPNRQRGIDEISYAHEEKMKFITRYNQDGSHSSLPRKNTGKLRERAEEKQKFSNYIDVFNKKVQVEE